MKPLLWAAIVVLAGRVAPAAEEKKQWKLDPEVRQIVDLALAAPPEFCADALLRLLERGKVTDTNTRRELIELAFTYAGRAQHPVRMVAVGPPPADSRGAFEDFAFRLGLDAMSLQARAIRAALETDPKLAREEFERINSTVAPRSCDDVLVADPSAYYELLAVLAQRLFRAAEGDPLSRVSFLQVVISRMNSHTEAGPAARLIASFEWKPSEFEVISGAYLAKLAALAPDDRSFAASLMDIEQSIAPLVAIARQMGAHPDRISEAYRQYLVKNFAAPRCADTAGIRARAVAAGDNAPEIFGSAVRGDIAPITGDEIRAGSIAGAGKTEPYWQSAESKRIFEECLKLRTGADGRYLTEVARSTREWSRQLSDFLNTLADWKQTDEKSEEDFYHERAIVYEALLELAPAGDVRNRVLEDYVGFLKSSNVQQINPAGWYWHAKSTLKRVRAGSPAEAQRIWAAFARSGNLVLSLEAALERVAPDYSLFGN